MTDEELLQYTDRMARLTGLGYVVSVSAGLFFVLVAGTNMVVWDDAAATAHAVQANESLFRTGFVAELIMAAMVACIAIGSYLMLRPFSPGIAISMLVMRIVEVALVAAVLLMKLGMIELLIGGEQFRSMGAGLTQDLGLLLAHVHDQFIYVSAFFTGLAGLLLSVAIYGIRLVPRALAVWGLITYVLLAGGCLLVLIVPQAWQIVQISFLPGAAFEASIGLWLLFRGIANGSLGQLPRPARV